METLAVFAGVMVGEGILALVLWHYVMVPLMDEDDMRLRSVLDGGTITRKEEADA